jgi:hypothetical protein
VLRRLFSRNVVHNFDFSINQKIKKMEETNDFDFLRSPIIIAKEKEFEQKIFELDKKHESYFKGRKSFYADEQDRIENHYYYYQAGNLASFGWKKECDLHPLIKEEVKQVFKEVFIS